jgi:hypothetical protein
VLGWVGNFVRYFLHNIPIYHASICWWLFFFILCSIIIISSFCVLLYKCKIVTLFLLSLNFCFFTTKDFKDFIFVNFVAKMCSKKRKRSLSHNIMQIFCWVMFGVLREIFFYFCSIETHHLVKVEGSDVISSSLNTKTRTDLLIYRSERYILLTFLTSPDTFPSSSRLQNVDISPPRKTPESLV